MEGLSMAFSDTDITVLAHIPNVDEIIDAYQRLQPDVLLCDIKFGQEQTGGLDILKQLLTVDAKAKVILLSQYDQDTMIKQSYNLGARAFLSKSIAREDLITAIQKVAKGELYFTSDNAITLARMTYDKAPDDRALEEILSEKELEAFKLISDGFSDKEVATKLDVTTRTVANLKEKIKEKLNVERNSSLTKIAIRHGLISMDD